MAPDRLGGLDAAFLAIETKAMHLHVAAVLILEPAGVGGSTASTPEQVYARIREAVVSRLDRVPVLRRRLVEVPLGLGRPFIVDHLDVDLDAHLRRAALPQPGTTAQLQRVVADIVSRPLDRSRPLWDLVVVEGLDDHRTAVVVRLHHAIADGIAGIGVLTELLDPGGAVPGGSVRGAALVDPGAEGVEGARQEEPRPLAPQRVPDGPEVVPDGPEVLRGVLDDVIGEVARSARAAVRGIRETRALVVRYRDGESDLLPRPFDAPRTSVNRAISPDREVAWAELPMAVIRRTGVALGGTVNDVVLTLAGGALHGYLVDRGEVPDRSLVAMVPVSTAGSGVGPMASESESESSGADAVIGARSVGNRVTGMLVSLATGVEDPEDRFRLVRDGTRRAKLVCREVGSAWLESWADALVPGAPAAVARALSDLRLFDRFPPLCNVVVSNVPGAEEPVALGGLRVAAMYPLGPISEGIGLNITVLSYAGTLHVGVQSCRALVPDPGEVASRMAGELDMLTEAAGRIQLRQERSRNTHSRSVPWWHRDVAV
jgi:WS/DGAT/MGAT family acyltransferase